MSPPRAAMLVTGDEILRGRVGERNVQTIGRSLGAHGVRLETAVLVGDALDGLIAAMERLLASGVDLIVTSGGLGPTHDDRTMQAVAAATGRPLRMEPAVLELVRAARSRLHRLEDVSEATRRKVEEKQATLPAQALVLRPVGTAPGCVLTCPGTVVCVLPGPPWELEAMWEAAVATDPLHEILSHGDARPGCLLRLAGVVESRVVDALDELPPAVRQALEIGVCARAAETEVDARGPEAALAALVQAFENRFGPRLYARSGETAAEALGRELRRRGRRLAVAESCTGGLLGGRLTAVPGSSEWFLGGVVAYDNSVKERLLGVDPQLLARHGAVSPECARAMAAGARAATGADWAASVTGIAGPGGGTADRPVGLVHLAVAGPDGPPTAYVRRFRGDRERIRERAVETAIHLVREAIAQES